MTEKNLKLKTLKDIPSSPNEDNYQDHSRYYQDKDLKKEAIKWVKFYQKGDENTEEDRQWLRMWIMKFFNITMEDLKWKKRKSY